MSLENQGCGQNKVGCGIQGVERGVLTSDSTSDKWSKGKVKEKGWKDGIIASVVASVGRISAH
jgi:hypothetical protein